MATLTDFRTRVAAKLGLDNSTDGDQALIDSWVNEGVVDVVLRSRCKVSRAELALTAGSNDYTIDTDIMRVLEMTISTSTQTYAMDRKTVDEILRLRRAGPGTAPARFYAVAGSNLLMLYPTPGEGEELTMYYVPRPTTLSGASDSPNEIPSEFHKLVEWYALSEGADYDDDSSSGQGSMYLAKYEAGLARLKKSIVLKGGTRLAPATPGRRRRPLVPDNNSTDVW